MFRWHGKNGLFTFTEIIYAMNKNFPDFGGFPTDNSSSTNLKYDIIASKFMTGIENHERHTRTSVSSKPVFYLIGLVVELIAGVLMILISISSLNSKKKSSD